jgi:hypothetical protein
MVSNALEKSTKAAKACLPAWALSTRARNVKR